MSRRSHRQPLFGATAAAKWVSSWTTVGNPNYSKSNWTELPDARDAVILGFVGDVVGKSKVTSCAFVGRTLNRFPSGDGFRASPATDPG